MDPHEQAADPMAALRARFLARCADDLEALRRAGDPAEVRALIHRLAGSAGAFGFDHVSRKAGDIDDRLHAGEAVGPAELEPLIEALETITRPRP